MYHFDLCYLGIFIISALNYHNYLYKYQDVLNFLKHVIIILSANLAYSIFELE
jgi:hypothetical protein